MGRFRVIFLFALVPWARWESLWISSTTSQAGFIEQTSTGCVYVLGDKYVQEETFHFAFPNFPNWEHYKCKKSTGGVM